MIWKKKITLCLFLAMILYLPQTWSQKSLQGDEEAIAHLREMIQTMGGLELWGRLSQLKFQHKWYPINRGNYVEDEIIDLTGPRSWVHMKSEDFERSRAYSPEHGYWSIHNGTFSQSEESYQNALKRAPFNIYRIAHAVAKGEFPFEIKMGQTDIPTGVKIEFLTTEGDIGGSVVLNGKSEPLVWETPQFRYTFGPMKKFGNLSVPNWAVYDQGSFRYEMIDLIGDSNPVDSKLFQVPVEYQ